MARKANCGSFKRGDRRAGRPKGVPNKATATAREAFAAFVEGNAAKVQALWNRVARNDPARALEIFAKLTEFVLPKVARTEISGPNGQPIAVQRHELTDEELTAIIMAARRPEET
jgi:hypothetical protein